MTDPETYRLYALRYAHHARDARDNFVNDPDPHEGPMPIDYFVWAAVSAARTVIIDTGFNAEVAARRGREFLRCPAEGLALIGIDAEAVEDVIVTHMHYDHVGNFNLFPNARFHLQDREMNYATGRHMRHKPHREPYDVDDVVGMVREVYAGRVTFHDGDAALFPGLSVHLIGGHTMGLQAVRVHTQRGWVVVASDAAHLYANMDDVNPYPIVFHVGDMLEGFDTLRRLADSEAHIVPGHDPQVLTRYPAVSRELDGICVRLDVAPKSS